MTNILVCDDDKEIVEAIEIYLAQEGYHVIKAYDGEQAIRALKTNEVHLLIIDVMMPRLDGIHATLKIREYSSIPIIILSAKSEDADKILGLNIGADDYVTKPFNPLELVARVKSHLRRYTQLGNLNSENNAIFRAGGLVINDETKEVTVDDEPVKLTSIFFLVTSSMASISALVSLTIWPILGRSSAATFFMPFSTSVRAPFFPRAFTLTSLSLSRVPAASTCFLTSSLICSNLSFITNSFLF